MGKRKVEGAFWNDWTGPDFSRKLLQADRVRFPFALTKNLNHKGWSITHIPTGRTFYIDIPSREVGRTIFKDLEEDYPEFFTKGAEPGKDWAFGSQPIEHPDYEKMHKANKQLKERQHETP